MPARACVLCWETTMTLDDHHDDLDERLARDAARLRADDAAPPFDVALDQAVSTRRPRHTWLAVAAAIAAVGVVGAMIVARPWHSSNEPAGGTGSGEPSTGAIPKDLAWMTIRNIGFEAVILDPTDPRSVSLMVTRD